MVAPEASGYRADAGQHFDIKLCVVMVGLPARGKSLIAGKLVRYLCWRSVIAKSFNVGSYRRHDTPHPSADFFDPDNHEGERLRLAAAEAAINDMLEWFKEDDHIVAILDATNSTKERRKLVHDVCQANDIMVMFVESICDDHDLIMQNVIDVKTSSPDYVGSDPTAAINDFIARIRQYEQIYETIHSTDEKHYTYVKLINVGRRMELNLISNYLETLIIGFLSNLHIKPRSIWLSRHGESEFNVDGKIGGDADLSERGFKYSEALPRIIEQTVRDLPLTIWTSTMKRTIQTARFLPYRKLTWKALDELNSGVCDEMTYEEIEAIYPEDFKARDDDKYNYRYRGGESYRDVVSRLEPVMMELEREENVFIVTHQAVLRCIYAYLRNVPQDQSPWMEIPLHTVIKLTPGAFGTKEERFKANIPAVSTFREKYSSAKHQDADSPSVFQAATFNH